MKSFACPKYFVLLVSALFSLAPVCGIVTAAPPSGMYSYPAFGGPAAALWDVSGSYHVSHDLDTGGGTIDLVFDIDVVQDGKGKLSGAGATTVTVDTEMVTGNYTVKGSVKTVNEITLVSANVKVTGTGVLGGASRSFSVNIKYTLEIDTTNLLLVGGAAGKASASGLGSGTIVEDVTYPLSAGMDGSWVLSIDVQPTGTKLTGTASALLSNGRTVPFALLGSYSDSTDLSKIKLIGQGAGAGAKLGLITVGSAATLGGVAGKMLGQTLLY